MQPGAVIRKAAEDNAADRRRHGQHLDRGRDRYSRRAAGGETIDAGGNGGKSNRSKAVGLAQFDRAAIAGCQRFIFAAVSSVPDRANGMNHMPGWQPISPGDFGAAGLAAMERAALGEKPRSGRAMDRTVHAAAAEQSAIGGVDDGVNAQ